jgi:hypothetical protein
MKSGTRDLLYEVLEEYGWSAMILAWQEGKTEYRIDHERLIRSKWDYVIILYVYL